MSGGKNNVFVVVSLICLMVKLYAHEQSKEILPVKPPITKVVMQVPQDHDTKSIFVATSKKELEKELLAAQEEQSPLLADHDSVEAKTIKTKKDIIVDLAVENKEQKIRPHVLKKEPLSFNLGPTQGRLQVKYKPETFYIKYANTLNNNNALDKIFVNRSTLDLNFDLLVGKEQFGYEVGQLFNSIRNKVVWGNPESNAQATESSIKLLECVFGAHKHFITRPIFWIRESWFKFCINDAFNVDFKNKHFFTLGAFPFELGRGISLGAAYAVGPRVLGFYSDNSIDQYAFGFKFSGDVIKKTLNYDMYTAILENKSDSFANTGAKIKGQQFDRRLLQERGSGVVNFVFAGRTRWFPIRKGGTVVSFEPYLMFNRAPEQTVEFLADSRSNLGTVGLASEFVVGNFEWGFDMARNFGQQRVFGWDRNLVEFENRNPTGNVNDARVVIVNSQVVTANPAVTPTAPKVEYDPGSTNGRAVQRIIDTSPQTALQNGQLIGNVGGVDLYNSLNRFRNPYINKFTGWMAVIDGAYNFGRKKDLKIAATLGYASGDENPNKDLANPNDSNVDGHYKGFIPLQELYSGYRVQSVFLLGGVGKAPRPLTIPESNPVLIDRLPSATSGFTNIAFVGGSLHWYPKYDGREFTIRPNILAYCQTHATKAFDLASKQSSTRKARNYLGLEVNVFTDAELLHGCKLYAIGSMFIPGSHYADIRGTPLTREELKILDRLDVTGITVDNNPLLGDNIAFTINIGLECRF